MALYPAWVAYQNDYTSYQILILLFISIWRTGPVVMLMESGYLNEHINRSVYIIRHGAVEKQTAYKSGETFVYIRLLCQLIQIITSISDRDVM